MSRIERFFVVLILLLNSYSNCLANPTPPQLIEINLAGSSASPFFEPSEVTLKVGSDYLLLLNNPFSKSLLFQFDEGFVDNIFTRYLSGSPNVSRIGVIISANNTVQWLLSVQKPGEFQFWANSVGQILKSVQYGKITLQAKLQKPSNKVTSQITTAKHSLYKKMSLQRVGRN